MNERRIEVIWVPSIPEQFVTWGSDLRLYRVLDGAVSRGTEKEQIGPNRYAELLNCVTEPRYIKCVDIWKGEGVLLAIGQATGRVSLLSFSDASPELVSDREFLPRHSRPCAVLAWHPTHHNLLAAGFERGRTEYGVVVWDLAQTKLSEKPSFESGNGEHCTSLAWIRTQPCLVAGLGAKIVKIFDTRSNMKVVNQTVTKATYGLSVDPEKEYRISGYSEVDPSVVIWDTRNFEKPIVTLTSPHQVTKVSWCPTRKGLIANSVRDSGVIMLRDIMSWAECQEDGEASLTERTIQPPTSNFGHIADFAWHPSRENTLLAMGTSGRFSEWTVDNRLTLNWSARHGVTWCSGGTNLLSVEPSEPTSQGPSYIDVLDVGVVMQTRAKKGYAGEISVQELEKFSLGGELDTVWSWILQCSASALPLDHLNSNPTNSKFTGVRSLLQSSEDSSQLIHSPWVGLESSKTIRTYHSQERELILKLCGWEKKRSALRKDLTEISRNAAIAVFNLDLKSAIEILKTGCALSKAKGEVELATNLNMVSLAVSGYSSEGSKLWREVVSTSLPLLPDPWLKSLFSFLTAEDESFSEVLDNSDLALVDRIAFASKFLSDLLLMEYLEKEWSKILSTGCLEGLIISSSHFDSMSILQAYVDRTGDIQTACWISVHIFPGEVLHSSRVVEWIENYRTMLDQWNMFAERSELDICLTKSDPTWETQLQVYIACNYCGKSISNSGRNRISKTGSLSRQGSVQNKSKAQACPSCRKPLPRCAVCLVNMGTMSGLTSSTDTKSKIVTRFGEWFTWCQTCRHGGHAEHLLEWFSTHTVCSVTGCACKCGSLDANSHVNLN